MKLFLKIPEEIFEQMSLEADGTLNGKAQICSQLSTHINYDFEDMLCDDDDTYLREISDDDYIFGAEDPDSIKAAAVKWNASIKEEAFEAMKSIDLTDAVSLPMDDTTTYRLKKAVLALNNDFYPFADLLVLVESDYGSGYMTPLMPDSMVAQAEVNPAQYCITTIHAK